MPQYLDDDDENINMCRWHCSLIHTTNQCLAFKGFLNKKMRTNVVTLTMQEYQAMNLAEFNPNGKKGKAKLVEINSDHEDVIPCEYLGQNQKAQTYKEAIQKLPLQAKAIEGLKKLRYSLCHSCADCLHFELVRSVTIPNDPNWVPQHHKVYKIAEWEENLLSYLASIQRCLSPEDLERSGLKRKMKALRGLLALKLKVGS